MAQARTRQAVEPLATLVGVDRIALVVGAAVTAVGGLLVVDGGLRLAATALIGVIVVVALLWRPALTLFALLVVSQEINPADNAFGGASTSTLLTLGHQIYFTTASRISLVTFLALIACAGTAARGEVRRPRLPGLLAVLAVGLLFTAELWIGGTSLKTAINQDCRFVILFVAAFYVGSRALVPGRPSQLGLRAMAWLFTLMALLGGYLYATGQGDVVAGVHVIFYDSALSAIAGAFVLAVVLAPRRTQGRWAWWAAAAAMAVVVLASRRNVWAGMVVALLLGVAVIPRRGRLVVRLLVALGVALAALAIFDPKVTTGIGHQLSAIWQATQGSAADASTQGHLSDVSVGWHAVQASPWSGVGPNGHVPGLVVENSGPLYIHNQVLESWLRFGLLGAIGIVLAQVVLLVQALRVLRRHRGEIVSAWASYLLVLAPISMLTAPFFTETQRWPAIMGLAAGMVAIRRRPASTTAAGER